MSKLFTLKKWLTIADAAKHLAIVFCEEVTEADVLRFALDGKLKLSVNFVNGGSARAGKLVPIGEATYKEVPALRGGGTLRLYGGPTIYTDGVESHILKLDTGVASLEGLYDLPMIGGERLDIENRYQALTGGPEITTQSLDGAFVEAGNGVLGQLQQDHDDNEYFRGSTAALDRLKRHIAVEKIGKPEAEKLLMQHKEDRQKFLEERKSRPGSESFHPTGSLPDDCVCVVRTAALTDFVQSVNEEPASIEKPLGTTERNTLLTIIAVLAKAGKVGLDDYSKPGKAAGYIEGLTDEFGAHVSKRAIEDHLKKIPDALGTRMK